MNLYDKLMEQIDTMPIIDTHEHLPHTMEAVLPGEKDVLNRWLRHYLSADMVSAGMTEQQLAFARDASAPLMARWRVVEPFWQACRYTGYGQAVYLTARDLYGVQDITADTLPLLQQLHQAIYQRDFMYELMHDKLHIEKAILDGFTGTPMDKDSRLFVRVWNLHAMLCGGPGADPLTAPAEKQANLATLDGWMGAVEATLEALAPHIAALKCSVAYTRSLSFEKVPYEQAKAAYARDYERRKSHPDGELPREVQDFMLHHILGLNLRYGLPVQVHTGLLEGFGNRLDHSNPMHLNDLLLEHPGVHFDIFHIGWPFIGEATALVKMHHNATLDFCWAHMISPSSAVRALMEALDSVPVNKIMAFGGDYVPIDLVYGHVTLAKRNLARALAAQIEMGAMSVEQALDCAHRMLYDNPKRVFKL
nr:amidohydrolase family protein [bacterium]